MTVKLPSVGIVSLGCPKNLVDSEVMMGLLAAAGAETTPRAEDADVIVVNTCSFIDSAKQESIDAILAHAGSLKGKLGDKFLIVPENVCNRWSSSANRGAELLATAARVDQESRCGRCLRGPPSRQCWRGFRG